MKFIGTQYYRSPHPAQADWAEDLATIQAHGIEAVRCWLYWREVEPEEGRWDWSVYDRFLEEAHRHGLGVLIQLLPESQPQWFLERHRALWPRTVTGKVAQQFGSGICTIGGYPGVYFDQPEAAAGMGQFIEAAVSRYLPHPALRMWDVWNEIMPHDGGYSFDETTLRRWQGWLRHGYGTIDAFNAAAVQSFGSFDEVSLVEVRNPNAAPTWMLSTFADFLRDRSGSELARRVAVVRAVDPLHPVLAHTHVSDFAALLNDDCHLAQQVDQWGASQYITQHQHGPADWTEIALEYAFSRSASGDKPWWLAEHSAGQLYYLYGHYQPTAAEVRAGLLQAAMHGAEHAFYWQYRPESFGQESPGWGLTALDGKPDDRLEAVRGVAEFLRRERHVLDQAHRPVASVGILHDRRTRLHELAGNSWAKQGVNVTGELRGWFTAAQSAGLAVDVYNARMLAGKELPTECRILIAPMHLQTRPGLYERLLKWVEAGGVLILTAYTGTFSDDCRLAAAIPAAPISGALGAHVRRRNFPSKVSISAGEDTLAGYWVLETMQLDGAEVVGRSVGGEPALLRRTLGQGVLWYAATLPGQGFLKTGGDLPQWLARVALSRGAEPWFVPVPGVLAERSVGPSGTVLYLLNQSGEPATVCLRGTVLGRSSWHDGITGAPVVTIDVQEDAPVIIPPRDALCLVATAEISQQSPGSI